MVLSKHLLNIALLRIGKHCIVKNIASLRKVNIAHPYCGQATKSDLTSGEEAARLCLLGIGSLCDTLATGLFA